MHFKHKQRASFGSQQAGHGRALLQKKAVVRQHLRLKNKTQAREKKKLKYMQSSCEGGHTEEQQNNLADTTQEDSPFSSSSRKNRPNNLQRAKAEYRRKIEEKVLRKEEALNRRKEAEEAKKRYKEKRLYRFKKLNQKTRKGQPLMRGKIELILETLQQAPDS
ncbi:hypothetical protein O3P69_006235 [Scylla paramamosain]|uniref:Thyroid transcription factor 1-associated protein 26 n=2 Tax=Scylla paramamosain TaxID=85552 RepID=A0AAW0U799_SCYPA